MSSDPVIDILRTAATECAARPAISDASRALSYSELWQAVQRRAAELAGLSRDSAWFVRAVAEPLEALTDFFACLLVGKVPVLADSVWDESTLLAVARNLGGPSAAAPQAPGSGFPLMLREVTPAEAFIRFTSGSTGRPKAILFEQSIMTRIALVWAEAAKYGPDDRVLCCASINNGLAFNTSLLAVLARRAHVHFASPRILPRALLRSMAMLQPTVLVGFPLIYDLLGRQVHDQPSLVASLRLAISAAAELVPAVKERWFASTGLPIGNYFGAAEVGPVTFNDGTDREGLGGLLPGAELSIEPDGRLMVKTPWMGLRYIPDAAEREEERLVSGRPFRLKDLGALSEQGQLRLTGRVGNVLNVGGVKVDPETLERELSQALDGAAVVITLVTGESPFLVAHIESERLTEADVRRASGRALAPHARPKRIRMYPRLPRSSTGKVLRTALESGS